MNEIFEYAGNVIYGVLALVALYGAYLVVMSLRRVTQKRFRSGKAADEFMDEVSEHLKAGNREAIVELCDSPPHWNKAVPQLILVAMQSSARTSNKLKTQVAESFERDVLADFEYRSSWISTIVKAAPMVGLLGTVVGMINAFAKISAAQSQGVDPKALATDISFALYTTAAGLAVAIPLVLCGALLQVRVGKLQDAVQFDLGRFFEELDENPGVKA